VLDQATSYTGQISGFGTTQSIDLTDIDYAAGVKISYVPNRRNTSGVLTITDGTNTTKLKLKGTYTLANFDVASDGDGGTLLTDPTVVTQLPGNAPASGFGAQNAIDSPGIAFNAQTTLDYLPNSNNTGGALSVSGCSLNATIALLGNYMASSFAMESDHHGGTMVVAEAPQTGTQLLSNPQHA